MEQLAVHGLVVRETDVGEYDKILTLITREVGKITVTAKGAKSLKNRNMIGEFPILNSGMNEIAFTGTLSNVEILARSRWI